MPRIIFAVCYFLVSLSFSLFLLKLECPWVNLMDVAAYFVISSTAITLIIINIKLPIERRSSYTSGAHAVRAATEKANQERGGK